MLVLASLSLAVCFLSALINAARLRSSDVHPLRVLVLVFGIWILLSVPGAFLVEGHYGLASLVALLLGILYPLLTAIQLRRQDPQTGDGSNSAAKREHSNH